MFLEEKLNLKIERKKYIYLKNAERKDEKYL